MNKTKAELERKERMKRAIRKKESIKFLIAKGYLLEKDVHVLKMIWYLAYPRDGVVECNLSEIAKRIKSQNLYDEPGKENSYSLEFLRESVNRLLDITIRIKDKNRHLNISPILGWMEDDHLNIEVSPFLKHIDKLMVPKDIRYK